MPVDVRQRTVLQAAVLLVGMAVGSGAWADLLGASDAATDQLDVPALGERQRLGPVGAGSASRLPPRMRAMPRSLRNLRMPPFSMVDRNADQEISRQEAAAEPSIQAQFSAIDANQNGSLTRIEYFQFQRDRPHRGAAAEQKALSAGTASEVPLTSAQPADDAADPTDAR